MYVYMYVYISLYAFVYNTLSERCLPFVSPFTNQSSSSATPRQKTRFVVRSGKLFFRSKRICCPNIERVPVPGRMNS